MTDEEDEGPPALPDLPVETRKAVIEAVHAGTRLPTCRDEEGAIQWAREAIRNTALLELVADRRVAIRMSMWSSIDTFAFRGPTPVTPVAPSVDVVKTPTLEGEPAPRLTLVEEPPTGDG